MKKYNKDNIKLARALRKNMTPWERKLWYQFLRTYPVKIYRQKAIGEYIVDFYCAKAGLVIELDGGEHFNSMNAYKDGQRTIELEQMGLKVIRIANNEVFDNFDGVCAYLDNCIKSRVK